MRKCQSGSTVWSLFKSTRCYRVDYSLAQLHNRRRHIAAWLLITLRTVPCIGWFWHTLFGRNQHSTHFSNHNMDDLLIHPPSAGYFRNYTYLRLTDTWVNLISVRYRTSACHGCPSTRPLSNIHLAVLTFCWSSGFCNLLRTSFVRNRIN